MNKICTVCPCPFNVMYYKTIIKAYNVICCALLCLWLIYYMHMFILYFIVYYFLFYMYFIMYVMMHFIMHYYHAYYIHGTKHTQALTRPIKSTLSGGFFKTSLISIKLHHTLHSGLKRKSQLVLCTFFTKKNCCFRKFCTKLIV